MAETKPLLETELPDKIGGLKIVRPGDMVLPRPYHLRSGKNGGEGSERFAREDAERLAKAFGDEPKKIKGMFTWPCGRRAMVFDDKEYISADRLMAFS